MPHSTPQQTPAPDSSPLPSPLPSPSVASPALPPADHQPQPPAPPAPDDSTVTQTTTTNTTQPPRDENGVLNPQSVTVESTPGGIRVKLPTLVLAHVLSLAGVCGGAYSLNKPDVDQTKSDIAAIAARMERIERDRNAVVERLARIETLAENIREDLRDARGYGGRAAPSIRRPLVGGNRSRTQTQNDNGEAEQ